MSKVFIIAEAGINHDGNIATANKLVEAAAEAGADAVKFQAYKTEKLVRKNNPAFDVLKRCELGWEEFGELKRLSERQGLTFFASFFDIYSLGLANRIGMKLLKIPSGEITNHLLLEETAKLGKDVILSTGMATMKEIEAAVGILRSGSRNVSLMHCISSYPANLETSNLKAILTLKEKFELPVGLSDHTLNNYAAVAAVAMGATMLEKHFTLSRDMKGPDHRASIEPQEMKDLVKVVRHLEMGLGTGEKKPLKGEMDTKKLGRKGLAASNDIPAGGVIKREMLCALRPEEGISPADYKSVTGKKAKRKINQGEVITWKMLS